MAAQTSQLQLVTPTQGTLSGTWGSTVNNGITEYVNIAIAGTLSFAGDGAITLANTIGDSAATNIGSTTAQYMAIRITGTLTATKVITGPTYSKLYMVENAATGGTVTFKTSAGSGVSVAVGERCFVYCNGDVGSDYVKVSSNVADGVTSVAGTGTVNGITLTGTVTSTGSLTLGGTLSGVALTSQVTGTLPVANGGTGVTTSTGSGNTVLSTSPTLVTPVLGTPSSGTLSACTVDGTNLVGYQNIPINSQSADYTLVLADAGKSIFHPSTDANDRTFTIPANASVAYPIGTAVSFINMSANNLTIAITSDTMYLTGQGTTGSRTLAQYGAATAIKMTSTTWMISGSALT